MRLGELLLSEKLVTKAALEEALEAQVIHGGRLGTNLIEMGVLKEQDLARCLGKLHNCAYASGEMAPDPRAMELLDSNFMDDKDVVPMRVEPTRIAVAVISPHDHDALHAIGFKTGKRVVPVVIPEFRMAQLLRRHCKAFRPMRLIDMNQVRPSKAAGTAKDAGPEPMASEELINDEMFQQLYAKAVEGAADDGEAPLEGIIIADEPEHTPARGLAAAPIQPPPASTAPPTAPPASKPKEPPAPPLSFPEAQAQLNQVTDREQVAQTVLRFAAGKWKRALLLSVQGDLVTGWHGAGKGVDKQAVQRIGINLRAQNTFRLVQQTRSHYIGPVTQDAGTAVFYKLLRGGPPTTAVILPLLVRGKLVHMLYVDNGPGKVTPPDIGEVLILAQSVARSYEAMIRRRKAN